MHSFVIYSQTRKDRNRLLIKKIGELLGKTYPKGTTLPQLANPDIIIIQPNKSIGIESIRQLKTTLSKKSFNQKRKIAIISSTETLTLQAQQALLKTLEEPSSETYIFLELYNPYQLLPTILSRCELLKATPHPTREEEKDNQEFIKFYQNFSQGILGERLAKLREIKNKENARDHLLFLLRLTHKRLLSEPELKSSIILLNESLASLEANINFRLVLEHLLLSREATNIFK